MKAAWLTAKREIATSARSRAFQIGVGAMVLIAFLATALPGLAAGLGSDGEDRDRVAVVGVLAESPGVGDALAEFELVPFEDVKAATEAVRTESVEAALVPQDGSVGGLRLIALEREPKELVQAVTVLPAVELLEPPAAPEALRIIASLVCAVVFMFVVVMYAQAAATNTVVEKQTRVVEILLAAAPARSLLAGRILGFSVLAFASVASVVVAILAGLAAGGLAAGGQEMIAALDAATGGGLWGLVTPALLWFLVLFAVAFVLFAALMVASAATVSRLEDVSAVATPTMVLLFVPYLLVIMFQDNTALLRIMSFIPISAPTAMPPRLIAGDAAWWEPVVALGLLILTTWGVIVLAGRIYENSILRTGARIKLKDALRHSA
jgi:ABC-2 type transport system permease protein